MASLDARVTALEHASKEVGYIRPLTDADRAVRLMRTINGPDTPQRDKIMEFLKRTGISPNNDG